MAKSVGSFILKDAALRDIADIIRGDWRPVHPNAEHHVEAMEAIDTLDDAYYAESGRIIVGHFLANAMSWRSEVARLVKAELWSRIRTHDTRHTRRTPTTIRDAMA